SSGFLQPALSITSSPKGQSVFPSFLYASPAGVACTCAMATTTATACSRPPAAAAAMLSMLDPWSRRRERGLHPWLLSVATQTSARFGGRGYFPSGGRDGA